MGSSWVSANLFITKVGAEHGRLQKGVAEQLNFEIKEADTESCKIASNRQLECSSKAALLRKRVRNSRPAFWEC